MPLYSSSIIMLRPEGCRTNYSILSFRRVQESNLYFDLFLIYIHFSFSFLFLFMTFLNLYKMKSHKCFSCLLRRTSEQGMDINEFIYTHISMINFLLEMVTLLRCAFHNSAALTTVSRAILLVVYKPFSEDLHSRHRFVELFFSFKFLFRLKVV